MIVRDIAEMGVSDEAEDMCFVVKFCQTSPTPQDAAQVVEEARPSRAERATAQPVYPAKLEEGRGGEEGERVGAPPHMCPPPPQGADATPPSDTRRNCRKTSKKKKTMKKTKKVAVPSRSSAMEVSNIGWPKGPSSHKRRDGDIGAHRRKPRSGSVESL